MTMRGLLGATALLAASVLLVGGACGSSPGGKTGSGGAAAGTSGGGGTAAGTTGSGGAAGGGGFPDCPPPEDVAPGACASTYDEQVARTACTPGHPVVTRMCAGYQIWSQGAPWNMDVLDGDLIDCVYWPDGARGLLAERVCTTTWTAACQQVGTISCHTSGFVPIDPSNGACLSDGGVFESTVVCTVDGGGPG